MTDVKPVHFQKLVDKKKPRLEPATCTEAETFALQVLDDSMEPEFRKHCIVVIDPTGRATDGSYVLAQQSLSSSTDADSAGSPESLVETFLFRQLCRDLDGAWFLNALNGGYPSQAIASDLSEILGVVVQRAGYRRSYHKRYD